MESIQNLFFTRRDKKSSDKDDLFSSKSEFYFEYPKLDEVLTYSKIT